MILIDFGLLSWGADGKASSDTLYCRHMKHFLNISRLWSKVLCPRGLDMPGRSSIYISLGEIVSPPCWPPFPILAWSVHQWLQGIHVDSGQQPSVYWGSRRLHHPSHIKPYWKLTELAIRIYMELRAVSFVDCVLLLSSLLGDGPGL